MMMMKKRMRRRTTTTTMSVELESVALDFVCHVCECVS